MCNGNPQRGGGIIAEGECIQRPGIPQADRGPASTTTMTSWNSGQRTPLKLPSSQNITSRACCALAEVLMV
ncbi:hypothetical protein [Klebsiella pneumoniae]|uniref:hypothetical protein n=1 Tax=Klebsiella pneumoniae TaxID=573 RepID=UPI003970B5DD